MTERTGPVTHDPGDAGESGPSPRNVLFYRPASQRPPWSAVAPQGWGLSFLSNLFCFVASTLTFLW